MNTVTAGTGLGAGAFRLAGRVCHQKAHPSRAGSTRGTDRPLWVRSETGIGFERWFMLFLTLAAVIGITYGFSCLVDLVQNWAIMERGISSLI